MDIKKEYFELIKKKVNEAYDSQHEQMAKIAAMFGECMENLGVVQLFGVRHGEEFVNELNYRAGGIAPFHAYKFRDLLMRGQLEQSKIDNGEAYNDL
ncbi:MAG: SIS domain-containing protein [Erysipelotrichaceae bacterium]|nr:SIS domain-containing protein [Erysipelotrichaceae bacterium]